MNDSDIVAFLLSDEYDCNFDDIICDFSETLELNDNSKPPKKSKKSRKRKQPFDYTSIGNAFQDQSNRDGNHEMSSGPSKAADMIEERIELTITEEELFGTTTNNNKRTRSKKRTRGRNNKKGNQEPILQRQFTVDEPPKSEKEKTKDKYNHYRSKKRNEKGTRNDESKDPIKSAFKKIEKKNQKAKRKVSKSQQVSNERPESGEKYASKSKKPDSLKSKKSEAQIFENSSKNDVKTKPKSTKNLRSRSQTRHRNSNGKKKKSND